MARPGALALATSLIGLLLAAPAGATVFTVDTAADGAATGSTTDAVCAAAGGGCTLRAAIQEANGSMGADDIKLPARNYALTLPTQLSVTNSVTIAGEGSPSTT